ncbi:unnamed protein product [Closterium sp. NIES-53]
MGTTLKVPLVPAQSALALSGPACTVSRCPAATRTACPPHVAPCCSPRVALCCSAPHALLQPARRALLPCAPRPAATSALHPTAASASRPAALRVAPCCSQRVAPYCSQLIALCSQHVALCCPACRVLLQPERRTLLPHASRPAALHSAPPPSCPAASTAAAAARATAAAGGGAAGSLGSAAGTGCVGGATRSAGGAAGARGAGPTADRHCLSWSLSRQLQQLGVDNGGQCLSRATPPLSSFANGFFSKPVQRCVTSFVEAAALGAGESAAALGASEFAAALGASESVVALGASESAAALGASESAAALGARATPSTGPSSAEALHTFTLDLVVARASTGLPCPAVPSGSLSGLHLPTFSTNLVSNATIQDVWVDTFIPGGQRVAICTCSRTGRHLATSLPSLPRSPAPPCLRCVEGRQRAAPHSSEFPPTTAPLQTLHMDIWGPAPVGGTDQERYFLLVVDDYTRYTTVFPLRRKADISGVLIPWIRATHRQQLERFSRDFPGLRLHSDRDGEFSSDLLAEFCRDKGIAQSFTLPASPQKNGIAGRRIGLIMETSPTLRWTGKVGDASVFWVWGALSLVRDAKASKLSSRTLRCVFLGFPNDAPPWQFYHPHSRRVFSSWHVTFDESVCFYMLHPHASHPEISSDSSGPAERGDPIADNTAATHRSPRLETPPSFRPRPTSPPPQPAAVDSGAETAGAEPRGAETGGEGSGGVASGGAATGGAISGVAAIGGADSWGDATGAADSGGPASPSGGGAVGDPAGGPRAGQPPQPDLLETLSPQAIQQVDPLGSILWVGSPPRCFRCNCYSYSLCRTPRGVRQFFCPPCAPGVLQPFGFQFSSPQPTPLSTRHLLSAPPSDDSVQPSGLYSELVGCLMYLMTCTRPDLAYHLSLLARYVAPSRHQKVHWDDAKRVLHYLCSTSGMGLVLGGQGSVVLTGHSDASWADDQATQRSSQGYTFSLGSGSVSWRYTHSSSVLSSSCDAKFYAGAMAAQEVRWLTYIRGHEAEIYVSSASTAPSLVE